MSRKLQRPSSNSSNPDHDRAKTVIREAKFQLGQIVKHRIYPFRGVIYDVDPEFNNTEEWYSSIPEDVRPRKEQPFYHLYAENEQTVYEAYVSEQNLLPDDSDEPLRHPMVKRLFKEHQPGLLQIRKENSN